MNENGISRLTITAREWALIAVLVIAAGFIINSQITLTKLRLTISTQQIQDEKLRSEDDHLKNTSIYLFSLAAQAHQDKNNDGALSQYKQLVLLYPASSEAQEAKNRISAIQHEVALQQVAMNAETARQKAISDAEAQKNKAAADAKQRSYEESIRPPLKLLSARVTFNAIDNPEAGVSVRNVSQKKVDAYTVLIYCYNRYGNEVNYLDEYNSQSGLSQDTIVPGHSSGYDTWTLFGRETTSKVKIVLMKVHMTDGSEWEPQTDQEVAIWGLSRK